MQFATSGDAAAFEPSGDLLGGSGNAASTFESQFPDLTGPDAVSFSPTSLMTRELTGWRM